MAGKTAFQKIVDVHLATTLPDGSLVLNLDWVWGHEITTPNAIIDAQDRGCDVVFDPNRVKMMIDHINPAKDTASAIQGKIVREWSRAHGIEFLDVGRNGICHAVIPEKGWILPGRIGIMGDSHTCTHSAFCAFTAGVGTTELEIGVITGLWVCPPQQVIRVNVTGNLPANVFAKDLILALINKIGVKGATNAVLEFGGPVIFRMSMEGRMTMANMAVEAGATSGMMLVDEQTINYLRPVLGDHMKVAKSLFAWNSDPDAEYDQAIEFDVSDMVPVITQNYSPGDVVPVASLAGKPVDQVYIGSCTNGRIEDLRIAASIFRQTGGKVAEGTRCIIIPATQHIFERAVQEGLVEIFLQAGCFVSGPTCGACLGMSCGVIAPGEVCVSTTNRNFTGRMGKDAMVHLASPATAVFTAIKGKITEPTVERCELVLSDCEERDLFAETVAVQPTDWKERESVRPDYVKLSNQVGGEEEKDFSGRVFYLPVTDINTDQIIPAKHLTATSKKAFGKHCLEDAPIPPEERQKLFSCHIIVAGENFGCGSSREHAPWALEAAGIRCVIASSFARIFENSMFANGLLCITLSPEVVGRLFQERPEEILIDWERGIVKWGDGQSACFHVSDLWKDFIRNGGSVRIMLQLAAHLQTEGKI